MAGSEIVWRAPGRPRAHDPFAFLPLMRTAVERRRDNAGLLLDLVIALREAGEWREIVARLAPIADSDGFAPELAVELGIAANACGDTDRAREVLETALRSDAADQALDVPARGKLAQQRALVELSAIFAAAGDPDASVQALGEALARDPHDTIALGALADGMMKRSEAAALLGILDDLERRGASSTLLLSARANALGAVGAYSDLEALVSPERWCVPAMIGSTIDNQRLAQVIMDHAALRPSPGDRATLGRNLRLDALASRDEPEIRAVVSAVRGHVDAYVAARRSLAHPLMARMPAAAVLQGWALATEGDGHEARHIHPRSWITATYYVRVPRVPRRGSGPPPGAIVFGPWPAPQHPCDRAFPARHFEPREGMLLIFPSFLAHSTVPSGVAEQRLCVTLDVTPTDLTA